MRIITGKAKGTRLITLEGEATRPTAERVKEALFSMLQFDIEGRRVLDLFAGSGQMALEALSRGAASAVLVDKSKEAHKIILKNIEKTRFSAECRALCMDFSEFARRNSGEKFDIVFLDPPYKEGLYVPALSALLEADMLKAGSLVICESESEDIFGDRSVLDFFSVVRVARYGRAIVTILEKQGAK